MNFLNKNQNKYLIAILSISILSACGGGGGGGSTSAPTVAISSIKDTSGYAGLVVSPSAQQITIYGTNITSAMTVSISGSNISVSNIPLIATSVSTQFKANITIAAAPTEKYVNVSLMSGNTSVATAILGVANNLYTLTNIQTLIFGANSNQCGGCHGSGNVLLDLSATVLSSGNTAAADGLINKSSAACNQKLRVIPGDPRRVNSVLLDVIQINPVMSCNTSTTRQMPQSATRLSVGDVGIVTEWIAAGAR